MMSRVIERSRTPHVAPDPYVIGIDFGTTYSGVAWAWAGDPDDITPITNWKTMTNFNAENAKVPTEIYYGQKGATWGYEIPPDKEPVRWFKLLLVGDRKLRKDLRESAQCSRARDMIKELGKTPVEVIGDYLRLLWHHTLDNITRQQGPEMVEETPFKVWLTVPAIWDHAAREKMRKAAERAGITKYRSCGETVLSLVPEPEAAALATLEDFKKRPILKREDIFVVCDAGGGTVDLISYKVVETQPLVVEEYVEGSGKLCGAVFIDQAFSESLEVRVGKERWKRIGQSSLKKLLNDDWEHGIKRSFEGSAEKEWTITLPPEAFGGARNRIKANPLDSRKGDSEIRNGELVLKNGHVKVFFDRVTPSIRNLISQQVNNVRTLGSRVPKAILLVGGLGSCEYLFKVLEKENAHRNIQVIQPLGTKPWTAICRGAVIKGLNESSEKAISKASVSSRVSRLHYGTSYYEPFIEGKHNPADRHWAEVEGEWVARNQMRWYLNRGQSMRHQEPIRFSYYKIAKKSTWDSKFTVHLCQSRSSQAPRTYNSQKVSDLCTISCHCGTPFNALKSLDNGRTDYRKVLYEIEMANDGAALTFKVYVDGHIVGQNSVEVNFDDDSVWSWENLGSQLEPVRM